MVIWKLLRRHIGPAQRLQLTFKSKELLALSRLQGDIIEVGAPDYGRNAEQETTDINVGDEKASRK